jgi:hypothetical protein
VLPDIQRKSRSDCKEMNRSRGAARLAEAEPSYHILPERLEPLRLLILMQQNDNYVKITQQYCGNQSYVCEVTFNLNRYQSVFLYDA